MELMVYRGKMNDSIMANFNDDYLCVLESMFTAKFTAKRI